MELIKRNIHMDRVRCEAVSQIALEDDINVPENKPDVDALNMEKGEVVIEEVRAGTDMVNVRGKLVFRVLYRTSEQGRSLAVLEGKLPFDEKINLQGVTSQDNVEVTGLVEDLQLSIINSRKLSVQTLVTWHAQVEEIYDEEVPIGIHGEETVEYRRRPMELAQIVVNKNDIFRMKEEIALPSGYPNIFQILWSNISLRDMDFKVMNEKILLQGDVHLFILYEGEGENHPIRSYEATLPLNGVLECHGCREGMIPDIKYSLSQKELSIRPDLDGEERNVGLELLMDIPVKVYEEELVEVLSDIYGVSREVDARVQRANLRHILTHVTGKTKVTDHMRAGGIPILQLLHSEGTVSLDRKKVVENGILLEGGLNVRVMYITGDDKVPYVSTSVVLPYEYTLDAPGISEPDMGSVNAQVEQLQVNMLDGEELDVKAVLSFTTTVFQSIPMELISQIKVENIDSAKLNSLPGMVIYVVRPGDNLWNIGKKYYIAVDKLRELNGLDSDELESGQKLLIIKGY